MTYKCVKKSDFGLMANGYRRLLSADKLAKITKFRKCETPLMEPARAKASPFPETRDLGRG